MKYHFQQPLRKRHIGSTIVNLIATAGWVVLVFIVIDAIFTNGQLIVRILFND